LEEALQWALTIAMAFLALLIAIYVAVRVGAFAWYRTRRESAHRMMRELKGDD
jgi:hypothetical protein